MRVGAALRRSKTMKRKAKLVLAKETLRTLTQGQLPEVNGGARWTTSIDIGCENTDNSFCRCPAP